MKKINNAKLHLHKITLQHLQTAAQARLRGGINFLHTWNNFGDETQAGCFVTQYGNTCDATCGPTCGYTCDATCQCTSDCIYA